MPLGINLAKTVASPSVSGDCVSKQTVERLVASMANAIIDDSPFHSVLDRTVQTAVGDRVVSITISISAPVKRPEPLARAPAKTAKPLRQATNPKVVRGHPPPKREQTGLENKLAGKPIPDGTEGAFDLAVNIWNDGGPYLSVMATRIPILKSASVILDGFESNDYSVISNFPGVFNTIRGTERPDVAIRDITLLEKVAEHPERVEEYLPTLAACRAFRDDVQAFARICGWMHGSHGTGVRHDPKQKVQKVTTKPAPRYGSGIPPVPASSPAGKGLTSSSALNVKANANKNVKSENPYSAIEVPADNDSVPDGVDDGY
jgi:hypothetical protein